MKPQKNIILLIVLCSFCVFLDTGEAEDINIDFSRRYSMQVRDLLDAYSRSYIVARVIETNPIGEKCTYELELVKDSERTKVVGSYISGSKFFFRDDDKLIVVANPAKSFALRGHPDVRQPSVVFLGESISDYNWAKEQAKLMNVLLPGVYNFCGISLVEFFSRAETSIRAVGEQNIAGEKVVRVETYTRPYDEGLRNSCHHLDGWFLLDPERHMALREFKLTFWKKEAKEWLAHEEGSIKYKTKARALVPVIDQIHCEVRDDKKKIVHEYQVSIKSVKFDTPSQEEFTLSGCGVEIFEERPWWQRYKVFWILGIMALAFALIIVLRRRQRAKAA